MKTSRAFTLIELLVVIAIIAVLSSLLLPALSRAKAKGIETDSKNNLRQLGLVLQMYLGDFDAFPSSFDHFAYYVDTSNCCGPSISQKTLWCPGKTYLRGRSWRTTYRYNHIGTGKPSTPPYYSQISLGLGGLYNAAKSEYTAVQESRVIAPADMIAMGCGNLTQGTIDGTDPYPSPLSVTSKHKGLWPAAVHRGGANMVFCDGHVEWMRQTNWMAGTEAARSRWNNDNEAHPETWTPW